MGDKLDIEKIYSQHDVDNITAKVRESTLSKIEKDYVSKDTYMELEKKYSQLEVQNTRAQVEREFLDLGGVGGNFNDYWDLEKDNFLNKQDIDYKQVVKNSMESRKWAFGAGTTIAPLPQDKQVIGEMLRNDTSDLVEGTIYKKQF